MKKTLILFLLVGSLLNSESYFAQSEDSTATGVYQNDDMLIYGNASFGAATEGNGYGMFSGNFAVNAILKSNIYVALGYDLGIGGKLTSSNRTFGYGQYSFKAGLSEDISENFRIIPYVGIGYSKFTRTTFKYDEEFNATLEGASAVGSVAGVETTTKKRYLTESTGVIVIPVGADFHFHGKNVGFVIGGYANISKYTDLGLRLGLTFGKLK